MAEFSGICGRCKVTVTAAVQLEGGDYPLSPPPVMGAYHECQRAGAKPGPGVWVPGAQAVVLTLRGDPA